MIYKITHSTKYSYTQPVSVCHNLLHLTPRDTEHQQCEYHRVVVHPVPADREKCDDFFGNHFETFSIHSPHRRLTITATSRIRVAAGQVPDLSQSLAWDEIVEQLCHPASEEFLFANQFTTSSPRVHLEVDPPWNRLAKASQDAAAADAKLAASIRKYADESFVPGRPILAAANELNRRIHSDFTFDSKATTLNTPWRVAFEMRRGVCQDFAHIAIACLRSLGLPARYVSGYLRTNPPPGRPRLVGADASHAWISVFSGPTGWVDFDPTNNVIPNEDHITLAWGRDYNDVCPIRGVFVGGGRHAMATSVDVAPQ